MFDLGRGRMVNIFGTTDVRGKDGARGPAGVRGPTGCKGSSGPSGPSGDRGKDGIQGPLGPKGSQGVKGSPGSRGPAGIGGIKDMIRWFPDLALSEFRKREQVCLLLTDPAKDLHIGPGQKYVTWLSRSSNSGHDAVGVFPSEKVLNIAEHKYALLFEGNVYRLGDMMISDWRPKFYACIWITFQVEGSRDQFIISDCNVSNPTKFRGISASNKEIRIWGAKNNKLSYIPIEYESKKGDWITVFASWSDMNENAGEFVINDNEILGTFTCADVPFAIADALLIGGTLNRHGQRTQTCLKGAIASVEVYTRSSAPEAMLPVELQVMITEAQLMEKKKEEEGPPSSKIMKVM